jgi:hypothetical protein
MPRGKSVRDRKADFRLNVETLEDRSLPGESLGLFAMALGGPSVALMDHWLTVAAMPEPLIADTSQLQIASHSAQPTINPDVSQDSTPIALQLSPGSQTPFGNPVSRSSASPPPEGTPGSGDPVDLQSTPSTPASTGFLGSVNTVAPAIAGFGSISLAQAQMPAPSAAPIPIASQPVADNSDLLSIALATGQIGRPVSQIPVVAHALQSTSVRPNQPQSPAPSSSTLLSPSGGVAPLDPPGGGGGGGGGTGGGGDPSSIIVEYRTRDPFA